MGLKLLRRKQHTEATRPADMGAVDERYNAYFPRLFAYVRSCVGGEIPAEDIVLQAFSRAFSHPDSADEDRFRTVLFRTARRLCRPALKQPTLDGDDPPHAPRLAGPLAWVLLLPAPALAFVKARRAQGEMWRTTQDLARRAEQLRLLNRFTFFFSQATPRR